MSGYQKSQQPTSCMAPCCVYPPAAHSSGFSFPSSSWTSSPAAAVQFYRSWLSSSSTSSLPGIPEAPRQHTVPLPDVDEVREHCVNSRSSWAPPQPFVVDHDRFGAPNMTTVTLHPLLAIPQRPAAAPSLKWDLLYHPTVAHLENLSIPHGDLSRCAMRSSETDHVICLQSLVLIFPLLPMQIDIRAAVSGTTQHASGSAPCLTVGDVLEGLYWGLRAPIEPGDFTSLGESEQRTLLRACEVRCRCLPEDERSRHALRKVDYLARRRHFLGIRPAMSYEVPRGRNGGEVYVVELGTGDV